MAYNRKHWKKETPRTVHNQHKPFNPGRYGKVWNTIKFEHDWGRHPEGDAQGPVMGRVVIGNKSFELTFSETNRLIDELKDAQHVYNVGVRLGRTNKDAGSTLGIRRYNDLRNG